MTVLSSNITKDTVSIAANNDDGYFNSTTMNLTASGLVVGNNGGVGQGACFRFQLGTSIPAGATIDSCYQTMVAKYSLGANDVNVYITMEDASNASAFVNGAIGTQLSRARVDSLEWNQIESHTAGTTYKTPNFASVLQALVDSQGGLTSGNYINVWWDIKSSTEGALRNVYPYENGSDYSSIVIQFRQ
jgi:hypothetical protein